MYLVSVKAGVQIEDVSLSNQELCETQNATIVYIIARSKPCKKLIITQPTNALIVCHLFLNHFFKTLSLLLF